MGLFDWLRRKDAGETTVTTFSVTTRDVSVDASGAQDPAQREAFEEAGRVIHEFFADAGPDPIGASRASVGAGGSPGTTTTVIVDGETVPAGDPRAREAIGKAAARLREQGLGELAAELEARLPAAPAAGEPGPAAEPRLAQARPVPVGPEAAEAVALPGALPAPEAAQAGGPDEAPSAPAPPEPPAPPI